MNRFVKIGAKTLLSEGVLSHGSLDSYVADATRRAVGIGLAHFQDGAVHYLGKDVNLLKRGLVQTAHQAAYGLLRSYPRYIKYLEAKERDRHIRENSSTSSLNENGQYYQLIRDQKPVDEKKVYTDTIVYNEVLDFLELSLHAEGSYYDSKSCTVKSNRDYGLVTFVDLHPQVQVSGKNNIVLTTVQGRDYTRKEFISGGDLEITINGKITSKYPDIYPDGEVSKFLKLMQYKGAIECKNTILRQFKIDRLIIQSYSLPNTDCRNIQPYSISCVAVEPSEAVEIIERETEINKTAIEYTNKWIRLVKFGTEVVDPSSLLKISRLWI